MGLMRPGDKGPRAQYNIDGQQFIRDGSRLRPYEQMANLGFDFEDPSLMDVNGQPIDGSMGYAQGMNKMKRLKDKAYRDREWNSAASQLGLTGNWQQLRKQMLADARGKGVDDSELEYLWNAGPRVWQKLGYLGNAAAPAPAPQAPTTPLTPTNIVNTNRPPVTTRPPVQAPTDPAQTNPSLWNFNRTAVQPQRTKLPQNPGPTGPYTPQTQRPPVGGIQTGYMKPPKRNVAQLGF